MIVEKLRWWGRDKEIVVEKPHYYSIAFAIPLSRFVDGDREITLTPVHATVFYLSTVYLLLAGS